MAAAAGLHHPRQRGPALCPTMAAVSPPSWRRRRPLPRLPQRSPSATWPSLSDGGPRSRVTWRRRGQAIASCGPLRRRGPHTAASRPAVSPFPRAAVDLDQRTVAVKVLQWHLLPPRITTDPTAAPTLPAASTAAAPISVRRATRFRFITTLRCTLQEDVNIMKKMGFDAYRFSISWSRIFPNGTGKVNWKGVAYYNRLINYMLKIGITPYANLYHYDLPEALEVQYGGLLNRKVVKSFADYADFCFKTFGDRVKNWMTFNEPRVVAALGYDDGRFAPGRCTKCKAGNSATEPYIVAHHLILSHAAAVQRYRQKYQLTQKGRIGILLDFVWYEALTNSPADQAAAERSRDFHVGWFLHPIIYGEYPKSVQKIVKERLPKFTADEINIVKGSIDYVGVNQYTAYYVRDQQPNATTLLSYSSDWHAEFVYERNGVPIGPRANSDWLYIVPWGLYKAVTYVKEKYGNPTMFLSENGMDDPGNVTVAQGVHDAARVAYYRSYISKLKEAIDGGANCVGYFAWSLLDNFEWKLGYTSRFGLVYVDFKTLRRYPKSSAYWFRDVITGNN